MTKTKKMKRGHEVHRKIGVGQLGVLEFGSDG